MLLAPDGRRDQAVIEDISRGGAALRTHAAPASGTELRIELPGAGDAVPARAVRRDRDWLAIAFHQDPTTLARVDRALAVIAADTQPLAA